MITRLSTMTPEHKTLFEIQWQKMLNGELGLGVKMLEPTPEFNHLGLRFPLQHLKDIGILIALLPLEIMANYVDAITKQFVDEDNYTFIHSCIHNPYLNANDATPNIQNINATSVGNLAYVALYCNNETARKVSEAQLNVICEIATQQLLSQSQN